MKMIGLFPLYFAFSAMVGSDRVCHPADPCWLPLCFAYASLEYDVALHALASPWSTSQDRRRKTIVPVQYSPGSLADVSSPLVAWLFEHLVRIRSFSNGMEH